jgi:RNA polymerase sigma-70 factor (ECF subfamily)
MSRAPKGRVIVNTVRNGVGQGAGDVGNDVSEESLVEALERLYPRIHARALFLTQERHAADDLVQQVCERALRAQASFRPGTDAAAWLHRVMRNLFIDGHRSRRSTVELREDPAVFAEEPPGPCDVLGLEDIRQAMTTLRPHEREILELAYLERFSYREISARLGLNERTTGTRLFRARAKLKEPLGVAYERRIADLRVGAAQRTTA